MIAIDPRWEALAGVHPADHGAAARAGRLLRALPGRWRWSIERGLRWWLAELGRAVTFADPSDRRAAFRDGAGRRATDRAATDASRPVQLVIAGDAVLTTVAPLAPDSVGLAGEILALEVEDQTPFTLDQVAAAYTLDPAAGGTVRARMHLVPTRTLADTARALGLGYEAIDEVILPGGDGALALRLPHERGARTAYGAARRARWLRIATVAAITAFMLAAALALPILLRQRALDAATAAVATERATLAPSLARVGDAQALARGVAAAAAMKAAAPRTLDLLARLTARLDESVYLTALRFDEGVLTMTGVAPDAAALVGVVEADPAFANARLTGPVAVDRADSRQRFELAVDVVGAAR